MSENSNDIPIFSDFLPLPNNPEEIFKLSNLIEENESFKIYKAIYIKSNFNCIVKILNLTKRKEIPVINENPYIFEINNYKNKTIKDEIFLINNYIKKNSIFLKYYGSYFSINTIEIWLIFEYCEYGSLYSIKQTLSRNLTEDEISFIIKNLLSKLNNFDKSIQNITIFMNNIFINKNLDIKLFNINILDTSENNNPLSNIIFLCLELFCDKVLLSEILKIIRKDNTIIIDKNEPLLSILSTEFIDFLEQCKHCNYPDIQQLLQHSFLTKTNNNINYLNNIINEIRNLEKKVHFDLDIKKPQNPLPKISSEPDNLINENSEKKGYQKLDSIKSTIDVLANFRFEQMLKQENPEDDKVSNKDFLFSIKTINDYNNKMSVKRGSNFLNSIRENNIVEKNNTINNNIFSPVKTDIKNSQTEYCLNHKMKNLKCKITELNKPLNKPIKKEFKENNEKFTPFKKLERRNYNIEKNIRSRNCVIKIFGKNNAHKISRVNSDKNQKTKYIKYNTFYDEKSQTNNVNKSATDRINKMNNFMEYKTIIIKPKKQIIKYATLPKEVFDQQLKNNKNEIMIEKIGTTGKIYNNASQISVSPPNTSFIFNRRTKNKKDYFSQLNSIDKENNEKKNKKIMQNTFIFSNRKNIYNFENPHLLAKIDVLQNSNKKLGRKKYLYVDNRNFVSDETNINNLHTARCLNNKIKKYFP